MEDAEAEYGMPFWDVIKGFAADGYGVKATAEILGYGSSSNLRRMMQRHGVEINFRRGQETITAIEARAERKGKPATEAQLKATRIASAANPCYIYLEYKGIKDTIAGHAKRVGLSVSTARKRYERNKDPAYVFSLGKHYKLNASGKGWHEHALRF